MTGIFATVLNMSLTASIMILIVLLARVCLKKAPKIYSYILWSVVLFRLLCPVSVSLPVSILAPMAESSSQSSAVTATMEYVSLTRMREQTQLPNAQNTANNTDNAAAEAVNNNTAEQSVNITQNEHASSGIVEQKNTKNIGEILFTVISVIWLAGVAVFMGVTVWQNIMLKRRLDTAFLIRGNIYESENIETAFIFGVFNPKIYLPLGLSFDVQKTIVSHEQTHQGRGDHIVKALAYIALAVHWFNPLVWLSFMLMCDDMEKSCDEAVIRKMYDRGYTMKSVKYAYGQMLLALGGGKQHIFSPVSFAENSTKSRVKNVVAYNRIARNAGIALCTISILIICLCAVNPMGKVGAESLFNGAAEAKVVETECGNFRTDATELTIYDLEDISFLKEFTELRSLTVSNIHTDDWSALQYCQKLEYLDVFNEPFEADYEDKPTEMPYLQYCPNLKFLSVVEGMVQDISPVLQCPQLEELQLWYISGISNFSAIESLDGLKRLTIAACSGFVTEDGVPACDFTKLPNLEYLDSTTLEYTDTTEVVKFDLTFLTYMPKLKSLRTNVYSQKDIDIISSLPQLEELEITVAYSGVGAEDEEYSEDAVYESAESIDFSPLKNLVNLKKATCDTNGISDPLGITDYKYVNTLVTTNLLQALPSEKLEYLYMGYGFTVYPSVMQELSKFTEMKNLRYVFDGDTSIVEVAGVLRDMENLQSLEIETTATVDLYDIKSLTSLNSLKIAAYDFLGTAELAYLKNLEVMELINYNEEGLEDISFLNGLDKLRKIDLSLGYSVSDLSVFYSLENVTDLILRGNFNDLTGLEGMKQLESLTLWQNYNYMYNSQNYELSEDELNMGEYEESEYYYKAKWVDASPIAELTALKRLDIENFVINLSLLDNLTELESLQVRYLSASEDQNIGNRLYVEQFDEFLGKHPICSVYYPTDKGDSTQYNQG